MKFCQPHWQSLRDAIAARGLNHLIAKDGKEAVERMVKEVKGEDKALDFDPLMSAHWAICGNAIRCGGLYLMSGDYCPLCELNKHAPSEMRTEGVTPSDAWIEKAADGALEHAKGRGLQG